MYSNRQTIEKTIEWIASFLRKENISFGHGTDNPIDEAAALVFYALKKDSFRQFQREGNRKISLAELKKIKKALKLRIESRLPLGYIFGRVLYCDKFFFISKDSIIPRSPIGLLLQSDQIKKLRPKKILDLCCGSGALAIIAQFTFPEARIDAVDISEKTLRDAKKNRGYHSISPKKLRIIKSDLFQELKNETYDLIITNPPYVSRSEMKTLPAEYQSEPRTALTSGKNGLEIVKRILNNGKEFLHKDGILIGEVGYNQKSQLKALFPDLDLLWPRYWCDFGIFFLPYSNFPE